MPMCLIVGCSRKSGGARGIRLCRVPAVVTNQGPEVEELSTERRWQWISILNNDRVCDQHFHSGTAAPLWDRRNINWVPTLNLGHGKSVKRREQNKAQVARAERSKERQKRQAELQEQERLLKLQKLNEPRVPPCPLCFWDCWNWKLEYFRGRASSRGDSRPGGGGVL